MKTILGPFRSMLINSLYIGVRYSVPEFGHAIVMRYATKYKMLLNSTGLDRISIIEGMYESSLNSME